MAVVEVGGDKGQCAFAKIESALDRLAEAHFWIHKMEDHYHDADYFRWYLNAFLKAVREVPEMTKKAMTGEAGFDQWFGQQIETLKADGLLSVLRKNRNFVVHRAMLLPRSRCTFGTSRGSIVKMGMSWDINPLEDSDAAVVRVAMETRHCDFLGLTTPDEDTVPFIEREWCLQDFDQELVDLCASGWLRVGEFIADLLRWQGVEPPTLSLDCRHSSSEIRKRTYDRDRIAEAVRQLGRNTGNTRRTP